MSEKNNDVNNVTAGKPKVGGAVFRAKLGTELPTDATTPLNAAFENMGYISEDGVTLTTERETEAIKAWGGDTVANLSKGQSETYKLTFIEALRDTVLKSVRGDENVSGTLSEGLTVKSKNFEDEGHIYVIEQILRGGVAMRTVILNGKITEIDDTTYADDGLIGYGVTIACEPNDKGEFHHEYYKGAAA